MIFMNNRVSINDSHYVNVFKLGKFQIHKPLGDFGIECFTLNFKGYKRVNCRHFLLIHFDF